MQWQGSNPFPTVPYTSESLDDDSPAPASRRDRAPARSRPLAGQPRRKRSEAQLLMALSERQLAAFTGKLAGQIPFDTGPRHLAGPGDARHVTHGLAATGWVLRSDPLSSEVLLRSPDHRYRLQFDPQSSTSAWWRLHAEHTDTAPGWYAEFGELVPAEVLAAVTDSLIGRPLQHPDPWQSVTAHGWDRDGENTARSPDSLCRIELRPLDEFHDHSSWHVETREFADRRFPGPRVWHAYFTEHTPRHLVDAFLTALTDPAPLHRGMYERTGHHSAVKEPSPLRPQQVADAHITRINALRARARSARRQQTKPTPAPATSTRAAPAPARPAARR